MIQSQSQATETDHRILAGVIACFILSGFAALLYQTAWLRQFSVVFGTSELAVATVLAAYMAGLASGAAIADRWVSRIRRPILVYGVLEAGIAVSALSTPLLLDLAAHLYTAFLGGQAEIPNSLGLSKSIFYLLVAFLVLALPTGFMGATLPFLTRYAIHSDQQIGPRIATLYSTNTLGAVLGVVTTAFILLPHFGLQTTVFIGVSINALVFILASLLAKQNADLHSTDTTVSDSTAADKSSAHNHPDAISFFKWLSGFFSRQQTKASVSTSTWILPLVLVSGITSFSYEVLWTRLLNHVLGGSIFAFATMLGTFLTGIALGSAFATRLTNTRQQASFSFVITQIGIALGSILVYFSIDWLMPETFTVYNRILFAASVLLPSTLFIGATFPLAVRILTPDHEWIGNTTAKVYSWNTVGGIVGSVLAGFWLIPALDYSGAILALVGINFAISVIAAIALLEKKHISAFVALFSVVVLVLFQPQRPEAVIHASYMNKQSHINYQQEGEDFFYAVGRSATILMRYGRDGFYRLQSNGLNESRIRPRGYPSATFQSEHWLSALPTLLYPEAKEMLVVGFGGGVVVESIVDTIESVDVIELEPEVLKANRAVSILRQKDPFADPRLRVIHNDARGALALTDKRYDIVVSQPSHPWTAGASHLYTREFARIVADHLTEQGIFLQWIYAPFIDLDLLKSMMATLKSEFAHVNLYQHRPGTLHFVASQKPLDLQEKLPSVRNALEMNEAFYSNLGSTGIEDLLLGYALDDSGVSALAAAVTPNTDDVNALAMLANVDISEQKASTLQATLLEHDPLLMSNNWHHNESSYAYMLARMLDRGFEARAHKHIYSDGSKASKLFGESLLALRSGNLQVAQKLLSQCITEHPDFSLARSLLLKIWGEKTLSETASAELSPHLEQLSPAVNSVFKASRLAREQRFQELENLDQLLASVPVQDPWYTDAARLRAHWRIHTHSTKTSGIAEQKLQEALVIIDRGLRLDSADLALYQLRLRTALALQDLHSALETAAIMSQLYRGQYQSLVGSRADARSVRLKQIRSEASALADQLKRQTYFDSWLENRAKTITQTLDSLSAS